MSLKSGGASFPAPNHALMTGARPQVPAPLARGTTSIHFVEPGVKVNARYYREDVGLLMQNLLPAIRQLSYF